MTSYVCGCGCDAMLVAPGDRRDGHLLGHRPTPREVAQRKVHVVAVVVLPVVAMAIVWAQDGSVRGMLAVGLVVAMGSINAFFPKRLSWKLDLMHWITGREEAYDWWAGWTKAGGGSSGRRTPPSRTRCSARRELPSVGACW